MTPRHLRLSKPSTCKVTRRDIHPRKLRSRHVLPHSHLPEEAVPQISAIDDITFPYYAPQKQLPDSIPSLTDIEGSKEVLLEKFAHRVVAVGPHFVVKYGMQIDLEEGKTMMFIKEQTTVPVPCVYALFYDPGTQKSYIVMERIQGATLDEKWGSLTASEKQEVGGQIKKCLAELRSLPTQTTYCSVGNKPLRDPLLITDRVLYSEEDVNETLIQKSMSFPALCGKAQYYKRHIASIFNNHPAVFTHGDLQRKNIIVQSDLTISVLDWATAGWYPSYWEYCQSVSACRFQDDWDVWLDRCLTPYPIEWSWFQMMISEMWG